jgi:hypothetical protein
MGKRWRKHRARACKAEWDPKVPKRAPSQLEGPHFNLFGLLGYKLITETY